MGRYYNAILAAIFLCSTPALAGAADPVRTGSIIEEQLSVRRVVWPILVSAKRSADTAVCRDLAPEQVQVTEDGSPVVVKSLDRERRPTLHLLLLDTSDSMSMKHSLDLAREAAKRYVDWLEPYDSIAVLSFDDIMILRAQVTRMNSTTNREEIKRAIDAIQVASGPINLRDSLNQLIPHVESFPERKIIIVRR